MGRASEKSSQDYAAASWKVIKNIEDKTKDLTTKKNAISITMGYKVAAYTSENYDTFREAGIQPYWETNDSFKTKFKSGSKAITAGDHKT